MVVYISVSFILQTKDDFRFIIPYVEFSRATRGPRPLIVDTSVIIDGRIVEVASTGVFESPLLVPRFVLNELQTIADSGDRLKRSRGRRGLEVLEKLKAMPKIELRFWDGTLTASPDTEGVDQKLVALAQQENARIMTNDFNLNKVAGLRGITVININSIADALKPVVLPGETMKVRVVKPGEGPTQGVGYLEDGTMVVVEGARDKVGAEVELVVTNALQTAAGKMIFGRTDTAGHVPAPQPGAPPAPPTKREPRICIDDGRLSMTTIDSDLPLSSVAVTTSGRCRSMRGCPECNTLVARIPGNGSADGRSVSCCCPARESFDSCLRACLCVSTTA